MSEFYGDLVVIAGDPIEIATRHQARDLRRLLVQKLAVAARKVGEEARWRDAVAIGCPGRTVRGFGVEMSPAPLAGVGFWRDYRLSASQVLPGEDDSELATSIRLHTREVAVVEQVCSAASELAPTAIEAQTAIAAFAASTFEEGQRRRLAYALAFEATIATGAFAPLTSRHEVLVRGSAAELDSVCPRESADSFSIALNLLDLLNGLAAYPSQVGVLPSEHPWPVVDALPKRELLWDRINAAVARRQPQLGDDGRIAYTALCEAAREAQEQGWRFVSDRPRPWSSEPDSARYIATDDDAEIPLVRDRHGDPDWIR